MSFTACLRISSNSFALEPLGEWQGQATGEMVSGHCRGAGDQREGTGLGGAGMLIDAILTLAWVVAALWSRVLMAQAHAQKDEDAEYRASRVHTTALIWVCAEMVFLLLRI